MISAKRLSRSVKRLRLVASGLLLTCLGSTAMAQTIIPDEVIASSALPSEEVARHSDGLFRERAFPRLPSTVYFTIMWSRPKSDFADQLLRGLQLFAQVAGVSISFPTTKLDLMLLVVDGWADKVATGGAAYLQSLGLPKSLAEALAERIPATGARDCYAVPLIGKTGFITAGVALMDEGGLNPTSCLPGVLFTLFGLQNTPRQDRSSDIQRLLLLKEIYSISTEEPFRDLSLEAVRHHFEFGQNTNRPKLLPHP